MTDRFAGQADSVSGQGTRHFAITPSNTVDLADRPKAIYCQASGTAVIVDADGNALPYAMTQGQILPFRGVRINATGTSGTFYGWS